MATSKSVDPELKRSMQDSLKAYTAGSSRFFNYLDDKARVYIMDSAEPIIGRKAFQNYYGRTLAKVKRRTKVVSQDIQMMDGNAVLAQTLEVTGNGVASFVQQTVIWSKVGGQWKMTHIHNAGIGAPVSVGRAPVSATSIRVLNERIATAAATVGVAQ